MELHTTSLCTVTFLFTSVGLGGWVALCVLPSCVRRMVFHEGHRLPIPSCLLSKWHKVAIEGREA